MGSVCIIDKTSETHYVTLTDIRSMTPCMFPDGKNPVTGVKCKEAFQQGVAKNAGGVMSDNSADQLYFACLTVVGIYVLYRVMVKSK